MVLTCSSWGRRTALVSPGNRIESSRAPEKGQKRRIWNEDITELTKGRGVLRKLQNTARHENPLRETPTGKVKDSEKKIVCQPTGFGLARTIEKLTPSPFVNSTDVAPCNSFFILELKQNTAACIGPFSRKIDQHV
jgi:hypothetical protein